MLDNLKPVKRLHLITSIGADIIIVSLICVTLFLPLKTNNKNLRLWGLGMGVVAVRVSFYLLSELNKMEMFINGNQHLEENNFVNNLTLLKTLNDQYYQNQLQPRYLPQNNYQDEGIDDEVEQVKSSASGFEFYDWHDCIDEAVGFIVSGNSGSGKTSVACWLAGLLTQEKPAQVLAMDPHWNDTWEQVGVKSIGRIEQIEKVLKWLLNELDHRCELKEKKLSLGDDLIIFCDEVNACLERFENPKKITSAIKRLGSEGRKFGITFIILNQSHNATDLDVSEKYLNNYFIIGLCASARAIINSNFKQNTPEKEYIKSIAYPCVVSGSVPVQIALHPTHHSYSKFKKHGNPPLNLLPINQLPLLILNQAVGNHMTTTVPPQLQPPPNHYNSLY